MKREPSCRIFLILLATLVGPVAALADHLQVHREFSAAPAISTSLMSPGPRALPAKLSGTPVIDRRADVSSTQSAETSSQDGAASTASSAPAPDDLCSGVTCIDGNPCTSDACDPATGKCVFTPTPGVTCDDGNACTTQDVCNAAGQCARTPTPGVACNNGNPCTRRHTC